MSITLVAYPMAFLINPEDAKSEKLRAKSQEVEVAKAVATKNLKKIKVLTNITYQDLPLLMYKLGFPEQRLDIPYIMSTGLRVRWINRGKYMVAELSANCDSESLQVYGEEFFNELDGVASRNVRMIESSEYFYYQYDTSYKNIPEIYTSLKNEGATGIFSTAEDEVVATVDGKNIKYFKDAQQSTYTLEVEQKISILNIGVTGAVQGTNITYGLSNLKIQTNIKPEELKSYLRKSNYLFYEANCQTPLKNSDATLNWVLKNGYYIAEFSGSNNAAITKEAEVIFRKLNIAAGRDLRLINDTFTAVYTYNTNYTDKGTLFNTLTEHGAEEIQEVGEEVSCKLFGMEMIYYKKNGESGYTLDVTQVSDKGECEDVINDLNDEYGLNIQEITYNKIKERLAQENLRLESETVMDDNSIVLTIEI